MVVASSFVVGGNALAGWSGSPNLPSCSPRLPGSFRAQPLTGPNCGAVITTLVIWP